MMTQNDDDDLNLTVDYDVRLGREIAKAEQQAEAACQTLREATEHPASSAYRMRQQLAMVNCGTWMGLLMARGLLTGQDWEVEYAEKFHQWMSPKATPCEHFNLSESVTHGDGHQTARCFDCDSVVTIGEETP